MRKDQTEIDQLPDEILMCIFAFLGLASISNATMVQRRWHQVLSSEQIWTTLLLRDFPQFYSTQSDTRNYKLSFHALYQKELKIKKIINCMIFGKKIPKIIRKDDSLWEMLHRRMFIDYTQEVAKWRKAVYTKAGDMDEITNKFDLIIRSGYADILHIFSENIKKNPAQQKHTQKSWLQRFQKKHKSEQVPQPTLSELINRSNSTGATPLFIAVQSGYLEIVKILTMHNANANQIHVNSHTPLITAAQEGHYQIVKVLIKHQANVNQATNNGATPLYMAASRGHYEIAKLLIENDASVNHATHADETPLHAAAKKGHLALVKLLINRHAKVNIASAHGNTPLISAAKNNHLAVVKLLCDNHVNVNQANEDGRTPLYFAVRSKNFEMAKLLINNQANVNQFGDYDEIPLYIAARHGSLEMVKLLIQHGADYKLIPESLISCYPQVNISYRKAQAELLEEQQQSMPKNFN